MLLEHVVTGGVMWDDLRVSSRAQICFSGLNPFRAGANSMALELCPYGRSSQQPLPSGQRGKLQGWISMRLLCLTLDSWSQQQPWLPTDASHLAPPSPDRIMDSVATAFPAGSPQELLSRSLGLTMRDGSERRTITTQ